MLYQIETKESALLKIAKLIKMTKYKKLKNFEQKKPTDKQQIIS